MTDDPRELLNQALQQASRVVDDVRDDHLDLPTPCRSWNVGDVVEHMFADVHEYVTKARGQAPDFAAEPPQVAGDWRGTFRRGANELEHAWAAAGPLTGTITLPGMGELPATFPVAQQSIEFAVHTWDVAVSTGQEQTLDDDLAAAVLALARQMVRPEFRGTEDDGKRIGPEVPVAPDAPASRQLAGFMGRTPPG